MRFSILFCLLFLAPAPSLLWAQELPLIDPTGHLPRALSDNQILTLVQSVDRGLVRLKESQLPDGSFSSVSYAKPGITALIAMSYLSRGHKPGQGPYGKTIDKAIEYVLSQQKPSGLFAYTEIDRERIHTVMRPFSHAVASKSYNHGICMLFLGEVYGLTPQKQLPRLHDAITRGLKFTLELWDIRKGTEMEDGGFRYTQPWPHGGEADMSVTGWHAASFRSIRNAGFDVPQNVIDRIASYVIRNQKADGGFAYATKDLKSSYTATGAGILCLMLAGKYEHPATLKAAKVMYDFNSRNRRHFISNRRSWPYYTCYYMSQASFQLGGRVWQHDMQEIYRYLINKQRPDGLWPTDGSAGSYGTNYATAMAILSLTPCLQLLPIYQR